MPGAKSRSRFGQALDELLVARSIRQSHLADDLGVTRAYVSALTTGKKPASADRVAMVSAALDLTPQEDQALHKAAALDAGFRLDLPDDF